MRIPNPFKFVSATTSALVWWFRGYEVLVTPTEESRRKRICERCFYFDAEVRQCNVCTCLIDAKVVIASERCPLRLWGQWRRKRVNPNCAGKCSRPCR